MKIFVTTCKSFRNAVYTSEIIAFCGFADQRKKKIPFHRDAHYVELLGISLSIEVRARHARLQQQALEPFIPSVH